MRVHHLPQLFLTEMILHFLQLPQLVEAVAQRQTIVQPQKQEHLVEVVVVEQPTP
jgi:hypothetical protein